MVHTYTVLDHDQDMVVSYGPRKRGAHKSHTKLRFSHIHNSVIYYLMEAKVVVEVPAY